MPDSTDNFHGSSGDPATAGVGMPDLAALELQLAAFAARFEPRLVAVLADEVRPGEWARPARLLAALRHGVLDGGKRLRPFLVVESARMLGCAEEVALPAALAVELIHCYSLIHDDLPAMDNDDLRRGRPTVHRAFDDATAILAGDAALTLAFEVLAEAPGADPARTVAMVRLLARAAGLAGMVGGQMLDLAAEGRFGGAARPHATEAVRVLQAMKTGALLAVSVDLGALAAGADPAAQRALHAYGLALGAAFQVADDILDVEASAADLGKATGKDAALNKATLVATLGLDAARAERDRLASSAIAALERFGRDADLLRAAARFAAARRV